MKHVFWLVVLLSGMAFAQGVRYDSVALNPRGAPIPNATITLCSGTATGTPCSPAATSFTDITLGTGCASGFPVVLQGQTSCQATTDGNGNFGFWLNAGTYKYSISGPTVATPQTYTITVNSGSGSFSTITVPVLNRIGFLDGTTFPITIAGLNSLLSATCNGSVAGWVIIPAGNTVTGTGPITIPSNCRLSGGGEGMTVLKEGNTQNLATFVTTASGAQNIDIDNITIDGNSANNTGGGQGLNAGLVFFPGGPNHIRVDHVLIQNYFGLTGGTAPCLIFGSTANDILVTNSYFANCGASGHAADGVYSSGTNIRFIGNTADTVSDTGFVCEAFTSCIIANNSCINNTSNCAGGSGLITAVPSANFVMSNNTSDGGNSTTGAAFVVLNVAPGTMQQCEVSGNTVRNTTSGGGFLIKQVFGCGFDNNTADLISPASANLPFAFVFEDSSLISISNNKAMRAGGAGFRLHGIQNFTFTGNIAWMNSQQSLASFSGIEIQNGLLSISTTIAAGVGSTGSQTVTPGAMTNIAVGVPLMIGAGPNCSSASTECVTPVTVTATTFTAFFNQTHGAAVAVAEAPTNSGTITGNQSFGFTQGRGINITGATDNLNFTGNDFRFNNNNPGYASSASGNIRLCGNLSLTTANSAEECDFPNLKSPTIGTGSTITSSGGGGTMVGQVASTLQKAETAAADANVLTFTPPATAAVYRVCFTAGVSAATAGVIGWTVSYTDSNGNAQSNIAQSLFQTGVAAPALTFTTSAAADYESCHVIDINNAAANIVVKWVGGGTTTAKVSASIERVI